MLKSALSWFTNLYGLWIILSWVLAVLHPGLFTWFAGPWITGALATIMLGMGLTLRAADFRRVLPLDLERLNAHDTIGSIT